MIYDVICRRRKLEPRRPIACAQLATLSLLEMLRFYAQSFVSSSSTIVQIAHILYRGEGLRDEHIGRLGASLREMMGECEKVDLPMTLAQLRRIKEFIEAPGDDLTVDNLYQMLHELENRLWDELSSHVFYQLESSKVAYFQEPEKLIGERIPVKFPTANKEIIEAERCYALGRNTACVFHLMCALEVGLIVTANEFNVSAGHSNWNKLIDGIKVGIAGIEKAKIKPLSWRGDREFYSQAASHFDVLKDGWRNYTAHGRASFGEDDARRMMENVIGFMDKISERLSE